MDVYYGFWDRNKSVRYMGFGGGGKPKPPPPLPPPIKMPPPIATIEEIGASAMKAGEAERKRIRGRRGRASTILTRPGLRPATVQQAALKTTLG